MLTLAISVVNAAESTDESQTMTAAELAKEAHNPLSNLKEVILQLDVLPNIGPNKKTMYVETIQPVMDERLKLVSKQYKCMVKSAITSFALNKHQHGEQYLQ